MSVIRGISQISSLKVWARRFYSWSAFFGALAVIFIVALLGVGAIEKFLPGALRFVGIAAAISLAIGALLLIFNEKLVVSSMKLKAISQESDCPRLWRAVERGRGDRAMPRVYLMEEIGQNAFAFGLFRGAVAATSGLIKNLDDDEVAAVMAHEVGHLRNNDIVVTMVITGTVMFFAVLGWLVKELAIYTPSGKDNDSAPKRYLLGILIGGTIYYVGRLLAHLLRLFVSRQREFAADAISASTLGTPAPLASALRKISENPGIGSETASALVGFLCTADPVISFNDETLTELFSTHPSMKKRLEELEKLAT